MPKSPAPKVSQRHNRTSTTDLHLKHWIGPDSQLVYPLKCPNISNVPLTQLKRSLIIVDVQSPNPTSIIPTYYFPHPTQQLSNFPCPHSCSKAKLINLNSQFSLDILTIGSKTMLISVLEVSMVRHTNESSTVGAIMPKVE